MSAEPEWHLSLRCYEYEGMMISKAGYERQGALTRVDPRIDGSWDLYIACPPEEAPEP